MGRLRDYVMDLSKILIVAMTSGILVITGTETEVEVYICGNSNQNLSPSITATDVKIDYINLDCHPENSVFAFILNNGTSVRIAGVTITKPKQGTCLFLDIPCDDCDHLMHTLSCRSKILFFGSPPKNIRIRKDEKNQNKSKTNSQHGNGDGSETSPSACPVNAAATVLGILFGLTLLLLLLLVLRMYSAQVLGIIAKRGTSRPFVELSEKGIGVPEKPLDELPDNDTTVREIPNAAEQASSQPDIGEPENPYAMAAEYPIEA